MLVTKRSKFSGIEHTIDLPVTEEQIAAWENGTLIQLAMPNLSPDQREFMITGVTPEEWDAQFPEEPEWE